MIEVKVQTTGVFLDAATVDWGDLDLASLKATLPHWHFFDQTAPNARLERMAAAQVVITNKVGIDAALLAQCPQVRAICAAASGWDHIDVAAAQARGIRVGRVPAYATPSVVQHAMALLLTVAGHLPAYFQAVREGQWSASPTFCLRRTPPMELAGKTLGIIGYGALGQGMQRAAEALGMQVWISARDATDLRPGRVPRAMLLAQSDVVSLHCPLTPETRHLLDAAAFAMMKPGALVINTARGGLIEDVALAAALRSGQLGGAACDVLSVEPPPPDHPLLDPQIPNLWITPHIAWGSQAARQRLIDYLVHWVQENVCDV